ncbi:type II secretion system protein [Sulfurimonas sp. HSL-1716]|uniref:type II secretion system protein n=1 Tax=Hydrocurvibacter sulfurireducens TaxID=3131937 RepID=UPI0031F96BED
MRRAFTMIELIFAIVVIAITVISLPVMMRVNQNAIEGNVVQEALFASSAKMMQVLSYPWDEHSVNSQNLASYTKVVDIPGGTASYGRAYDMYGNADVNGSFRVGHIIEDGHRRFHNFNSADAVVSTINVDDNSSIDAIDDRGATNISFENAAATATGYKKDYKMNVTISYIPDTGTPFVFPTTGNNTPSNMKLITVDIGDTNGTLTLLRAYSANIGEIDFAKRRY